MKFFHSHDLGQLYFDTTAALNGVKRSAPLRNAIVSEHTPTTGDLSDNSVAVHRSLPWLRGNDGGSHHIWNTGTPKR
jgi:hypothetical protein